MNFLGTFQSKLMAASQNGNRGGSRMPPHPWSREIVLWDGVAACDLAQGSPTSRRFNAPLTQTAAAVILGQQRAPIILLRRAVIDEPINGLMADPHATLLARHPASDLVRGSAIASWSLT